MNCPRCGSPKTSTKDRKPKEGDDKIIQDQHCDDCGWHGTGERPISKDESKKAN